MCIKAQCEEWRDIPEYEDYQVSSEGRVKSFKSCCGTNGRILKPGTSTRGYLKVELYRDGKKKTLKIHKLIQLAFNLGDGVVDHIDGIKTDNRLGNLRIGSSRENNSNKECHRNGKLVGATFMKARAHIDKPWRSDIKLRGKSKYLGCFTTELEAHERYLEALEKVKA